MNTKATHSRLPARTRRLFAAAVFAGLGLTPPAAAQGGGRAAVLLPPQPFAPGELPLARGAIDDGPVPPFAATPVPKPGPAAAKAVDLSWLPASRRDPAVRPTAAVGAPPARSGVVNANLQRPATAPAAGAKPADNPYAFRSPTQTPTSVPPKPLAARPAPAANAVASAATPPPPPREVPTSVTPFVGKTAAGTQVLAGPPAFNWYGYGATTPGANRFAPAGQYPKASADWYSVTGATPGAFPVLVSNPTAGAGAEPPAYQTVVASARPPAVPLQTVGYTPQPTPVQMAAPPPTDFTPLPTLPPAGSTFQPAVPALPAAGSDRSYQPQPPLRVPTIPARVPGSSPFSARPTRQGIGSAIPPRTFFPDVGQTVAVNPSDEAARPPMPIPVEPVAAPLSMPLPPAPPVTARGQAPENRSEEDAAAAVVRQTLTGKADGIEVRWTAPRRMTVCFEVLSNKDGGRLVQEVSRRRELSPFQIDFCVLVK